MTPQQAKDTFEQGRIQPSCPKCNQSILMRGKRVKITKKDTYDYILAVAYMCAACDERFVAWIGEMDECS